MAATNAQAVHSQDEQRLSGNRQRHRPSMNSPPEKSYWYEWYVVGVLMVAYMVAFVDRQVITLLVEPIRADLEISDTGISLLMGLAFAIFYVTMGVPIARLSDRYS